MAHTTGRYTLSPESQFEYDLGRLSDLPASDAASFVAELDRTIASQFTRDYWEISLPNRLDTSAARSPVLFAYWAALNLLDADALFSDVRVKDLLDPAAAAARSIELHHLFPKNYLSSLGIQGRKQVNAIANMAYLDWSDNAAISGVSPTDYWPRMTANQDPQRLRRQLHWHALPVGWEQLDYSTFLDTHRSRRSSISCALGNRGPSNSNRRHVGTCAPVSTIRRWNTSLSRRYAASSTVRAGPC